MIAHNSFILAFEVSVHLAGNHEGLHSVRFHILLCMCVFCVNTILSL